MPDISSIFKSEISRLARKELRAAIGGLKKAANAHRTEIAALKRRTEELDRELRRLAKDRAPATPVPNDGDGSAATSRFSAKALARERKRLGLSAQEVGLLVGTSSQSIYNWEQAKAQPRARHVQALIALKTLSKKDAQQLVAQRKAA